MRAPSRPPIRRLTVMAQDPSVTFDGRVLMTKVAIPAETLGPGPTGFRAQVVDYDSTVDKLYEPFEYASDSDPYDGVTDRARLERDPHFHCQNAYGIAMSTLAQFESALGRPVAWSFTGGAQQIKIVPHAFAEANAFYSREDEALLFGYFHGPSGPVFTSLSYDIVAHETTHALVDGLRKRFIHPSSPDQAAFHEGFADVVALLSIFAHENVVGALLRKSTGRRDGLIRRAALSRVELQTSVLSGLAEQMGAELEPVRGRALRQSTTIQPSARLLESAEFEDPHRRGEVLVAAMMNAFLAIWSSRTDQLGTLRRGLVSEQAAVEEGARVAERLLTMAIRSLDYTPPVDLQFRDFLTALLTADREVNPEDKSPSVRVTLLDTFESYGIAAATPDALWDRFQGSEETPIAYDRSRFEAMQRDPEEVFRFVWENRKALNLDEGSFTYVQSVRPSLRFSQQGFLLRETVAEYVQILDVRASELAHMRDKYGGLMEKPAGMPAGTKLRLYGGGSLIFDDFGRLKYHVWSSVKSQKQVRRIQYLWDTGYYDFEGERSSAFAEFHRLRGEDPTAVAERW